MVDYHASFHIHFVIGSRLTSQEQLMKGEFPETLCIEQGVVLSCRFAESTVRWTSGVLLLAVVNQLREN